MRETVETIQIQDEAERAEDLQDLRALLRRYESSYLSWQREINRLLDESGLSYAAFAERCGLSRNTLRRWCKSGGAPRSRATYLKIAFGLSMTPEETDRLLVRYGGYPGLYAMDLFDAVCVFLLRRGGCRYEDAERLYARCADGLDRAACARHETVYAASALRGLDTEAAFAAFVRENGGLFRTPRRKLRDCLADRLRAQGYDPVTAAVQPVHSLFAARAIPARFEKDISQLMVHGQVPRRERLIALGLHLQCTADELNELLCLAGMEPLCAKNRLECILIYALQQLCLTHPELAVDSAAQLLAVAQDPALCRKCRELIEQYARAAYGSMPEEVDSVVRYARELLEELAPEEAAELLALI